MEELVRLKALLVIDMQEDYVGKARNKRLFSYDSEKLIKNINIKIHEYEKSNDVIVYIRNKKENSLFNRIFYKYGIEDTPGIQLVEGLDIVSSHIFDKSMACCFTNASLVTFLKKNDISKLELTGVDGNACVGLSAIGGAILHFNVTILCNCIGIANPRKTGKMKSKLVKSGVKFCN